MSCHSTGGGGVTLLASPVACTTGLGPVGLHAASASESATTVRVRRVDPETRPIGASRTPPGAYIGPSVREGLATTERSRRCSRARRRHDVRIVSTVCCAHLVAGIRVRLAQDSLRNEEVPRQHRSFDKAVAHRRSGCHRTRRRVGLSGARVSVHRLVRVGVSRNASCAHAALSDPRRCWPA